MVALVTIQVTTKLIGPDAEQTIEFGGSWEFCLMAPVSKLLERGNSTNKCPQKTNATPQMLEFFWPTTQPSIGSQQCTECSGPWLDCFCNISICLLNLSLSQFSHSLLPPQSIICKWGTWSVHVFYWVVCNHRRLLGSQAGYGAPYCKRAMLALCPPHTVLYHGRTVRCHRNLLGL